MRTFDINEVNWEDDPDIENRFVPKNTSCCMLISSLKCKIGKCKFFNESRERDLFVSEHPTSYKVFWLGRTQIVVLSKDLKHRIVFAQVLMTMVFSCCLSVQSDEQENGECGQENCGHQLDTGSEQHQESGLPSTLLQHTATNGLRQFCMRTCFIHEC